MLYSYVCLIMFVCLSVCFLHWFQHGFPGYVHAMMKCKYKYYSGPRNLQIMHTRLRAQCSALNSHLFNKNKVNSPLCLCRSEVTSKHFLLHCPRYENQRLKMLNPFRIILTGTPVLTITTDLLLSGSEHQSVDKTHTTFWRCF